MKITSTLFTVIPLLLGLSACSAHPPRKVVIVDDHPKNRTYVIVHKRPAKHRHCVKHRRHWHCFKN